MDLCWRPTCLAIRPVSPARRFGSLRERLIVRVTPTTYLDLHILRTTLRCTGGLSPSASCELHRCSRNEALASAHRSTLSSTKTITGARVMPNGVPYDGSSYNNDLGPGAYPANITHGTYFSSVVNAVTGCDLFSNRAGFWFRCNREQ